MATKNVLPDWWAFSFMGLQAVRPTYRRWSSRQLWPLII
jgi:hypothetical protein